MPAKKQIKKTEYSAEAAERTGLRCSKHRAARQRNGLFHATCLSVFFEDGRIATEIDSAGGRGI